MKKLLLFVLPALLFCGCSKPGTVTGVVTYFFNKYQGDKPDVGAVVYVTKADINDIEDFSMARSNNDMILSIESLIQTYQSGIESAESMIKNPYITDKATYREQVEDYKKSISEQEEFLKGYTKLPEDEYSEMASKAYQQYLSIKTSSETISATVDGSGKYSVTLPKGDYTFIFVSKGRQRTNTLEIGGQIKTKWVSIKSNSTQDVSVNFTL